VPLPVSDPTDQLLTLTVARDGRRAHIWAAGEVDTSTAPRLAAALDGALADGAPEVAVDLAGVTLLTCAGVHALAAGHRRAASAGGRVHVFASRAVVRRPLELSGLWQRVGADRDPGRRPHAA
jgi:anti-sigma B factor antagonist